MKKVALIFSTKLSNQNGASAVLRSLYNNTESFNRNGVELSLYSPDNYSNEYKAIVLPDDVQKGFYKKSVKLIKKAAKSNNFAAIIAVLGSAFRPANSVVKQFNLSNNNEEILFMHELFTCYKYIKKRKDKKKKIILVLHNTGDTFSMLKTYYPKIEKSFFYKYLLEIEKKVFAEIDKLGFVADYPMKNFLNLHPHFDVNKIFYVYNGISLECAPKKQSNKRFATFEICCVGTICERKGQRFIVEALRKLKENLIIPDVHFSMIGAGETMNELLELSKKYEVSKHISFYGSSDSIDEFLINSDIFILPSIDEGFPISILEAMRASLPIVSTKVGGIPEMIENGQSGIFIEPSDDGVYDFLVNINKYNWAEMGEKSNKLFLKKYTVDKMIESYSNMIKSL
jgi:glycosyltransferase involved in cell wall biosynthesis